VFVPFLGRSYRLDEPVKKRALDGEEPNNKVSNTEKRDGAESKGTGKGNKGEGKGAANDNSLHVREGSGATTYSSLPERESVGRNIIDLTREIDNAVDRFDNDEEMAIYLRFEEIANQFNCDVDASQLARDDFFDESPSRQRI